MNEHYQCRNHVNCGEFIIDGDLCENCLDESSRSPCCSISDHERKCIQELDYVRRLERALRMAADEPNIDKARAIADAVLMPSQRLSNQAQP